MKDAKKQVAAAGTTAMNTACSFIHNDDISHLVPQLVSVISHPEEIETTLDKLLETTFVATVDAPTLALITPLLSKCLRDRSSLMKRKASKIIENMCKLVQNPSDVEPFVPLLLPNLTKAIDEVPDPEVCEVASVARDVLVRAMGQGVQTTHRDVTAFATSLTDTFSSLLTAALATAQGAEHPAARSTAELAMSAMSVSHMAQLLCALVFHDSQGYTAVTITAGGGNTWRHAVAHTSSLTWVSCVAPYIASQLAGSADEQAEGEAEEKLPAEEGDVDSPVTAPGVAKATALARALRVTALDGIPDVELTTEVDDTEYICNFEFSLAFGGKILLHNTFLKLAKGHKYGIMGKVCW
jgi:elongation factor 3